MQTGGREAAQWTDLPRPGAIDPQPPAVSLSPDLAKMAGLPDLTQPHRTSRRKPVEDVRARGRQGKEASWYRILEPLKDGWRRWGWVYAGVIYLSWSGKK